MSTTSLVLVTGSQSCPHPPEAWVDFEALIEVATPRFEDEEGEDGIITQTEYRDIREETVDAKQCTKCGRVVSEAEVGE